MNNLTQLRLQMESLCRHNKKYFEKISRVSLSSDIKEKMFSIFSSFDFLLKLRCYNFGLVKPKYFIFNETRSWGNGDQFPRAATVPYRNAPSIPRPTMKYRLKLFEKILKLCTGRVISKPESRRLTMYIYYRLYVFSLFAKYVKSNCL